ncbi:MAG: cytochrome b N-terminal domain-containing protein [Planctomycetaceae bacterium]|nr:cytochrome b N-terminal domain-containing protein [Planctomycetaceae bacterium]
MKNGKRLAHFLLHLHPATVNEHALRPSFTWCMGGIAFFLFMLETVTGVLLMFYYRPTVESAYQDVLDLRDVVSLGVFRELHRWGGHAMVIAVVLHMYRVFLTGSYKAPREFNWCIGVLLLLLVLALSFTGYLLPWDQLSYWAITVAANLAGDARPLLLGGDSVAEETLNRFYVLHCLALPLLAAVLMSLHFWHVRKDGISGPPL